MTVADLVFYDVPGRGDVSVKIEKDDAGYLASVPGNVLWSPTLLDALAGAREWLNGGFGLHEEKA